jgi:hypothetical protein
MPDIERQARSIKAGSVSIEFAANSANRTVFSIVDAIMSNLLAGVGPFPSLTGTVARA